MARLLIALVCLLQGQHLNAQPAAPVVAGAVPVVPVAAGVNATVPATLNPIWPDVLDSACSPGGYCTAGAGGAPPALRGLCVNNPGQPQACWDACNTVHSLNSYYPVANPTITADVATQKAITMMVQELRTGKRYQSCPGSLSAYSQTICNVGERCTPPGLTWGRGMCVTITDAATQTQSDSCLDMCDSSIPMTTYKAPGKQAGTLSTVQAVQNGRDPSGLTTCPGVTVWVWLWFPILLCCLVGCCAASYVGWNAYKSRRKQGPYREPMNEERFAEQAYVQEQAPYQADYQDQEMPQPQTMDQMDDAGPMPVLEPQGEQLLEQGEAPYAAAYGGEQAKAGLYVGNLFDQPNLMAGLAPLTVAAPTSAYPMAGSNYLTAGPAMTYPAQGSMSVAQPMVMPAYGYAQGGSVQQAMTTVAPTYGAYGAYGTSYPATTSMRMG